MPASGGAVAQAEHHVDVKTGLAIIAQRNVTNRAQHLALLIHRDFAVGFRIEVEPADGGSFECADRSQGSALDFLVDGETGQLGECFLTGVEHDDKRTLSTDLVDEPGFHTRPPDIPSCASVSMVFGVALAGCRSLLGRFRTARSRA
jgi:hypothetical protein